MNIPTLPNGEIHHTGNNQQSAPRQEIERCLNLLCPPGEVFELRALETTKGGVVSGYYNDLSKLADDAWRCTKVLEARGTYLTINPCQPALLNRAINRFRTFVTKDTTADANILRRRWVPFDFDPVRAGGVSGIPATDEEHDRALAKAHEVRDFLVAQGFPAAALIMMDSGNGAYLLVAVDLANDKASAELVKRFIEYIDLLFSDEHVQVDRTMYNAARIIRLAGTMNRKGDDSLERPWRWAKLLEVPTEREAIPRDAVERIAQLLPKPETNRAHHSNGARFDLDTFIQQHGIAVKRDKPWQGGNALILEHCVFDDTHRGTSAVIIEFPSGALDYKCQHNTCADRKWADVRELYEPNYQQRKSTRTVEFTVDGELPPPSANLQSDLDWTTPEPLPGKLPAVHPFEPKLLPTALRPWICDIAERAQTPLDYPAISAIAVLSAVLGRRAGIYPKQHDSWLVIPNLWGIIVGPPGALKSPMMHEILRPLQNLERLKRQDYEEKFKKWQIKKQAFDKTSKKELSESDLEKRLQEIEDEKPAPERYITNDPTVEKLGELLKANPAGMLLARDELSGFLATFDRMGHEGDRAFYCEAWNGYGSYTFDRIARGILTVENLCLSVFGAITPGPLGRYLRETFFGERDDGLIQRFQLAVYPDSPSSWRDIDRVPNVEAESRAWSVFERFITYIPIADKTDKTPQKEGQKGGFGSFDSGGVNGIRRFSPQAQAFFKRWRTKLERRIRPPTDEHPIMLAHLGKYRSLMPSLALIFHLCDSSDDTPVSLDAAKRAAAWCDYLEEHARRIYYNITSRVEAATRFLGEKIQHDKLPSPFTARDVHRPQWTGLGDPEDVLKALEWLEDINWIRSEIKQTTESGGRPSVRYHINPKVRELA